MSFENFPYSNFHELNLDWLVQKVKEAYSPNNPPENIVLSINGQTGHVELFTDNLIRLPDVPNNVWNIYRVADDEAKGIQFDGDGAYRIYRDQRYKIYDEDNEPDYPVTSVNGQTGDVEITIPSALVRSVNGKTGAVITPFTNPSESVLSLDTNSPTNRWGLARYTTAGVASIYLVTSANSVQAYIALTPAGGGETIIQPLLTSADIPESAGVVSINTKTGVVTIYGSDILTTANGTTTIAQDISTLSSGLTDEIRARETAVNNLNRSINAEVTDRQAADQSLQTTIASEKNVLNQAIESEVSARTAEDSKINDELTVLENEIATNVSDLNLWGRAFYTLTGGVYTNSTNYCAVTDNISEDCIRIKLKNNQYRMRLFAWNKSDNTYAGVMTTANTFTPGGSPGVKYYQTIDMIELRYQYPDYYFKIDLSTNPPATITLEESLNVDFMYSTIDEHTREITALQNAIENIENISGVTKVTMSEVVTLPARFPDTGTDSRISANMVCMLMELSRPGVQHSNWTIETFDGYLTVAGTIHGLTDITLYLI